MFSPTTTATMVSSLSTSTLLCPKLGTRALSLSSSSNPKFIHFFHLGRPLLSPWNGLKHLGIFTKSKPILFHRHRKGKVVYASLFGVGAPEALVIGVVALLVFGPKGLAEVARNLGKTLRSFQPTIRELQDVSREFKSTLEREIGLDDISSSTQNMYNSNAHNTTSTPSSSASTNSSQIAVDPDGTQDPRRAYSSEEYVKVTEEQLKAASAQQQGQAPTPKEAQSEPQIQPPAKEAATTVPPPQKPQSETLPLDS
ncbi:PREDICTED: sec-independent protein translocase protein TATB, chloroplastic [Lupinus angustifolius]|uniref:sec-independent protein translocase protein TATB, chloroplastic n=1 Tax=Lupinus angustifolius TaxID=3871 RepID=UPI00092EE503|nr:PREDICTED: sec-independent protein translocase protein TATB, chloroplastic [Lupinus angustifolius]